MPEQPAQADFRYDSDEENEVHGLEPEADGIKNFKDEDAKKKREQDQQEKDKRGLDMIFDKQ